MSAVAHKALSDPTRFPGVLSAALGAIRADKGLSKGTLSTLATQLRGMSTDSIAFTTVPLSDANHLAPINGGPAQSTVLWDESAADRLFRQIEGDQPIVTPPKAAASGSPSASPSAAASGLTVPPGQIEVRVVNGVGTPGLAARAARDLHNAGFSASVVPGSRRGVTATVIQYSAGREEAARTLKAALPGARLKEINGLGSPVAGRHRAVVVRRQERRGRRHRAPTGDREPAGEGEDGHREPGCVSEASTPTGRICRIAGSPSR